MRNLADIELEYYNMFKDWKACSDLETKRQLHIKMKELCNERASICGSGRFGDGSADGNGGCGSVDGGR